MDVYRCNLNEKSCLSSTYVFDHVFVHETVRDSGQLDLKLKCGLFDLVFVVVRYVYINWQSLVSSCYLGRHILPQIVIVM